MHMGTCAEQIIKRDLVGREEQDDYAQMSYQRARAAWENGDFKTEVDEINIKKVNMAKDEEFENCPADIPSLRPLFVADPSTGSVTAGNTSKLADGACALLLVRVELFAVFETSFYESFYSVKNSNGTYTAKRYSLL